MMTDEPKDDRVSEDMEAALQADMDEAGEDSAPADDPLSALEAENAELRDRVLRIAADMENLRRRTARDVHDARTYAIANFARDMLAVADNLARALEAIPEGARRSEDEGYKALIDGVELTGKDMLGALERHGVKKLAPQGEKFDPNFHQAMFEVPNPDVPNNTVVQVVQEGYVIGERVLRPAMVGVSRGGPKQGAANGADTTAPEPGPIDGEAEKDA